MKNQTKLDLYINKLYEACTKDTCDKAAADKWSDKNKFLGHSLLVSFFIAKEFGGKVFKCNIKEEGVSHYYNEIDGKKVDPTIIQYKYAPTIEDVCEIDIHTIIFDTDLDTLKRNMQFDFAVKRIYQNNIAKNIGEFLLAFGGLETKIKAVILDMVNELGNAVLGERTVIGGLLEYILNKNSFEANIDLLNYLVKKMDEPNALVWTQFFSDIKVMQQRRNEFAHGLCLFNEYDGDSFTKATKRGAKEFNVSEVEEALKTLYRRINQLESSMLFDTASDQHWASICKLPRLKTKL